MVSPWKVISMLSNKIYINLMIVTYKIALFNVQRHKSIKMSIEYSKVWRLTIFIWERIRNSTEQYVQDPLRVAETYWHRWIFKGKLTRRPEMMDVCGRYASRIYFSWKINYTLYCCGYFTELDAVAIRSYILQKFCTGWNGTGDVQYLWLVSRAGLQEPNLQHFQNLCR